MTIRAASDAGVLLPVGGQWLIGVEVRDAAGQLADGSPVVTVTLPDGATATPTAERVSTGYYRATYTVGVSGRYVARVTLADDVADFAAYATGVTTEAGMPTAADVATYLGDSAASWTTEDMQDALDAEADDQRSKCRIRAVYPPALRQALLRRVARNLALRSLPLAVLRGDAEIGDTTVLPGRDPEVQRLEAPHRKVVFG